VNRLFRLLRDQVRPDMPEHHERARPGEQKRSILDFSHSEGVLGWAPRVQLEEGLAATVEWFRARSAGA
jgi:UDP-glucose 4-epimerase